MTSMENQWNQFNRIFDLDPYAREAQLTVISCEKLPKPHSSGATYRIACTDTLFYPEGGGQPGDSGFIGEARVLDTHYFQGVSKDVSEDISEGVSGETPGEATSPSDPSDPSDPSEPSDSTNQPPTIMHYTDKPLQPGQTYPAKLDWARRFSIMQQHSGEHILSGLTHTHFGYDNVGFHLGETEMTVDFSGPLNQTEIDRLILETNQLIWQNVPLETEILSAKAASLLSFRSKLDLKHQVRLIKIPGGDICACSGTHVRQTGEIGSIICTKFEKWKQGVRLTLLCGDRAQAYNTANQAVLKELNHRLHLPTPELSEGLTRLENRITNLEDIIKTSANLIWEKAIPLTNTATNQTTNTTTNTPNMTNMTNTTNQTTNTKTVVLLTWPLFDDLFIKYQLKQFSAAAPTATIAATATDAPTSDSPATPRNASALLILQPASDNKLRFFLSEPADQSILQTLRKEYQAKGGGPAALSQGQIAAIEDPAAFARQLADRLEAKFYAL